MRSETPMTKLRARVRRLLRKGTSPLAIARKLHIPMLLIAEIAVWEAHTREFRGGMDL
jgi:hypothetical protein